MTENVVELSKREQIILLGCLNDASGYPYQKYNPHVEENKERFKKLFDKLYQDGKIDLGKIDLALLSLKQTLNHMDQYTLFATQDDVTLKEINDLVVKLQSMKKE
ncbi:MAG: hypothetical protein A3H61_00010 [Candidatus Jacksonbacteria bacterium RIFCSPLOWO2_02_FULL_44_20]|uniref:Uncharacterized protein n=1 Tax=Candidatus Jacksonbacteria bacterium RIFCSPLOWO2_02_FULL_44_20 TaxID=1798460 RepID=A0A1G2A9Y9_9BACT|nr:MAG: hypothetical protein A3H61_00010 [Candidatus Jacksonbacteria bacterium RIFCSPLOWO2_02_FULL_44_20]